MGERCGLKAFPFDLHNGLIITLYNVCHNASNDNDKSGAVDKGKWHVIIVIMLYFKR